MNNNIGGKKVKKIKKPKSWKGEPNKWLNTYDIKYVLEEYEKIHSDFKLIEVSPIDFDTIINGSCVTDSICNLDVNKLYNEGIRKIGIVFNLDKHDQSGSHWVALYVDINKYGIYFSDSTGEEPSSEVVVLMDRIKEQGDKMICDDIIKSPKNVHIVIKTCDIGDKQDNNCYEIILDRDSERINEKNIVDILEFDGGLIDTLQNKKFEKIPEFEKKFKIKSKDKSKLIIVPIAHDYKFSNKKGILVQNTFRSFYNDRAHQHEDTECGVYSLYWIINLLTEQDRDKNKFIELVDDVIRDKEMSKHRDIYWEE